MPDGSTDFTKLKDLHKKLQDLADKLRKARTAELKGLHREMDELISEFDGIAHPKIASSQSLNQDDMLSTIASMQMTILELQMSQSQELLGKSWDTSALSAMSTLSQFIQMIGVSLDQASPIVSVFSGGHVKDLKNTGMNNLYQRILKVLSPETPASDSSDEAVFNTLLAIIEKLKPFFQGSNDALTLTMIEGNIKRRPNGAQINDFLLDLEQLQDLLKKFDDAQKINPEHREKIRQELAPLSMSWSERELSEYIKAICDDLVHTLPNALAPVMANFYLQELQQIFPTEADYERIMAKYAKIKRTRLMSRPELYITDNHDLRIVLMYQGKLNLDPSTFKTAHEGYQSSQKKVEDILAKKQDIDEALGKLADYYKIELPNANDTVQAAIKEIREALKHHKGTSLAFKKTLTEIITRYETAFRENSISKDTLADPTEERIRQNAFQQRVRAQFSGKSDKDLTTELYAIDRLAIKQHHDLAEKRQVAWEKITGLIESDPFLAEFKNVKEFSQLRAQLVSKAKKYSPTQHGSKKISTLMAMVHIIDGCDNPSIEGEHFTVFAEKQISNIALIQQLYQEYSRLSAYLAKGASKEKQKVTKEVLSEMHEDINCLIATGESKARDNVEQTTLYQKFQELITPKYSWRPSTSAALTETYRHFVEEQETKPNAQIEAMACLMQAPEMLVTLRDLQKRINTSGRYPLGWLPSARGSGKLSLSTELQGTLTTLIDNLEQFQAGKMTYQAFQEIFKELPKIKNQLLQQNPGNTKLSTMPSRFEPPVKYLQKKLQEELVQLDKFISSREFGPNDSYALTVTLRPKIEQFLKGLQEEPPRLGNFEHKQWDASYKALQAQGLPKCPTIEFILHKGEQTAAPDSGAKPTA